jgi:hypothetical protein
VNPDPCRIRGWLPRALHVLALAAVALTFGPTATAAAAAGPSLPPVTDPGELAIQAWLDEQLPPDVPVGRKIQIGATLWDPVSHAIQTMNSGYVRVHAAKGSAMGPPVSARFDWPGHLTAEVTIPKGGLGKIEVGVSGSICDAAGACRQELQAFSFGGYGPPPDARRTDLVDASIEDIPGPVNVGDVVSVTVDLVPKAAWGLDTLDLPDRLVLEAAPARGSDLAQVDLPQSQPFDGSYHGDLTIPNGSDLVLRASIPAAGGGPGEVFPSVVRLAVLGGDTASGAPSPVASAAAPGAPASPGPDIPLVPILIVTAVVIGGGYLVMRVLADL